MSGGGGWPMTVFLTPEGKPFYGGTYYPPDDRWGRPGFPRILRASKPRQITPSPWFAAVAACRPGDLRILIP
mgnify:CR=1 FL=1